MIDLDSRIRELELRVLVLQGVAIVLGIFWVVLVVAIAIVARG